MNPLPPEFVLLRLDSLAPSFVARNPFQPGLIIGSDSGILAFSDENGYETQPRFPVSQSGEAINGIAALGSTLAVTTAEEVTVVKIPKDHSSPVRAKVIEHGAHGVVAVGNQRFLAPIGHDGILVLVPAADEIVNWEIVGSEEPLNFYQLCPLPTPFDNRYYVVAACRTGGIQFVDMSLASREIGMRGGPFADTIDATYLGNQHFPFAVGVAGVGGEIFLCRDIIRQEAPITLHYQNFAGRVYRILAGHGHVFVLTSKALYVLGHLARRLTQPVFDEAGQHPVMTIPMTSVDATIVDDRWLFVVNTDSIARYDLGLIDRRIDEIVLDGPEIQRGLVQPDRLLRHFPSEPRVLSHVG